jgi:hypothetical protein
MEFFKRSLPVIMMIFIFITACENTNEPIPDAEYMTSEQIAASPQFFWYQAEFDNYRPNIDVVKMIKEDFDTNRHKVYCFVKPACSCKISQEPLAHVLKTLKMAGIDDKCIFVYSMTSTKCPFPKSENFQLKKLPSIMIVKNDTPVFSLMELIDQIKVSFPDSTARVENLILEGLSK